MTKRFCDMCEAEVDENCNRLNGPSGPIDLCAACLNRFLECLAKGMKR